MSAFQTDQRQYKRIPLNLSVRFMLPDGSEHKGSVINISAGGLAVKTPAQAEPGAPVVLYIDEIGRVEGHVVRSHPTGLAMTMSMTAAKRERMVEMLTALANRETIEGPGMRRHDRVPTSGSAQLVLPDGSELACRLLDLSLSGVSLEVRPAPAIGTDVVVGRMKGRVVRHHDRGIAVEFREISRIPGSLAGQLARASG